MPPARTSSTKLGAKWQLEAALLSRPVDLTALVTLSQTAPNEFFNDDTVGRMVKLLLNATDDTRSDKDTRLDVLTVLSNLAAQPERRQREHIKMALEGINEWFDDYMTREEARRDSDHDDVEPELHKLMLLLLARLYDYKLKTEDLLELVRDDKVLGLETVVGLLEDGETYTTELHRKQTPAEGRMGQWEHKLVCHRHEKPLILQLCRILKGFTLPQSYFQEAGNLGQGKVLTEHSVAEFTEEMNLLMDITMKSKLVEKLALACHECLFTQGEGSENKLEDSDHQSIACVHSFVQNLYFYASHRCNDYRQHLLTDTLLIPRLILPYLDRSVLRASELSARAEAYHKALALGFDDSGDDRAASRREAAARRDAGGVLECPALVQGISASLRTLVVASFRAPPTRFMLELLRRLNPTESLLRAATFVARHDYIFALLCLLNINMGALDLSGGQGTESDSKGGDDALDAAASRAAVERQRSTAAMTLLHSLAEVFGQMTPQAQSKVFNTVVGSGALPVSRDTPSFAAVMNVLAGGSTTAQKAYVQGDYATATNDDEEAPLARTRADAKSEAKERTARGDDGAEREACNGMSERLDAKSESKDEDDDRYRLLGALPTLGARGDVSPGKAPIKVNLELPNDQKKGFATLGKAQPTRQAAPDCPAEFSCAINGHLLKEPVRSPHGHVFERSTIELWIATRGSVCPITGQALELADLKEDTDVRSRLMCWQINRMKETMQTSVSAMHGDEDDLYDF
ncbi:hypothetical protein M885DRAFT_524007 [Pelagophyceae sp. CCMP2097]|nr:hypothetical protein M885DRAFT_524007 [Pelagophyceae sp. CCMP2097]|mmetsp:Transcript_10664/g.35392  ORF Transcript_10664/g.35392 Transcript_10664/m.35392 type:complete len:749 (+) Transcript_10664:142-2388(+)